MRVDAERVAHVFENLVGNALRHTPRGGEGLALGVCRRGRPFGSRFAIPARVSPPSICRTCSKKFYRVQSAGRAHSGGAGLGLAIAREIVVSHGGQIGVESQPGEGSRFTFTLPASPDETGQGLSRTSG